MENKTLFLERRGCPFFGGDEDTKKSDIGNYRVCTPAECIQGKDGNNYFFEFTRWERYTYREKSKVNNKPLKHPVKELVNSCGLHTATQYTDAEGLSWRNGPLEAKINSINRDYTKENILQVVNSISADNYTAIEFI